MHVDIVYWIYEDIDRKLFLQRLECILEQKACKFDRNIGLKSRMKAK